MFSFYPVTDEPISLTFHVIFPRAILKVNVKGTMITIEKCKQNNRDCEMENEEGAKHVDYIKPHQWNEVRLNMDSDKMEIIIDDRKVLTKQIEGYDMKSNEIYWKILYNEKYTKGYETNEPDVLYYVQFHCPGFDDSSHHLNFGNESPNDHNEYESADLSPAFESPSTVHHDDHRPNERPFLPRGENNTPTEDHPNHPETNYKNSTTPSSKPSTGNVHQPRQSRSQGRQVGLIVGLVILGIIIITLVIIIINMLKKSRSMSLNETSPLSNQQQQETKH